MVCAERNRAERSRKAAVTLYLYSIDEAMPRVWHTVLLSIQFKKNIEKLEKLSKALL